MPRKQTTNRRYNQFVYGGLNMGKIYRFDEQNGIKYQDKHDVKKLLLKLDKIKSEECREYHKFVLEEFDDANLIQLFAFFILEIFLVKDILVRCMDKIEKKSLYLPTLVITELEREIRRKSKDFYEFKGIPQREIDSHLEVMLEFIQMRFESYFLYEMLKDVHEDIILVCKKFRREYLHNLPSIVKGVIVTDEVEDLKFVQFLSSEFGLPIAHCGKMYQSDEIAIIDGYKERITFNPDEEDIDRFHVKYLTTTYRLGEKASYNPRRINMYAQAVNAKDLDRITSGGWYRGIAPFKTEYFFITRGILPSVDDQIAHYVDFFKKSNGMPIYLRIPDFRPEKPLKYMENAKKDTSFFHNHHNLFFQHFEAVARAVKITNADVKITIPRVVMNSELSDWKRHVIMAFTDEDLPIPEFGYVLETESAFEYYEDYFDIDFVIIGFNDLIEEHHDHLNRFSNLSKRKFEELFIPILKDIHYHLRVARTRPIKHILAGNIVSNPFIFKELLKYGFTDFSIPVDKIRFIEPALKYYCDTRGSYIGVYQERLMRKKIIEDSKKNQNNENE